MFLEGLQVCCWNILKNDELSKQVKGIDLEKKKKHLSVNPN